jgi:hypothetical protein
LHAAHSGRRARNAPLRTLTPLQDGQISYSEFVTFVTPAVWPVSVMTPVGLLEFPSLPAATTMAQLRALLSKKMFWRQQRSGVGMKVSEGTDSM